MLHEARRVAHRLAVAGQVKRLAPAAPVFRARPCSRSWRRRAARRSWSTSAMTWSPEKIRSASLKRKGHVVGGVAGRRHAPRWSSRRRARPRRRRARRRDGNPCRPLASSRWSRRYAAAAPARCGPSRVDLGAGRGLDLGHGRRMVAMGVGDKNVGDGLAAHGVEQRRDVRVVVRTRIEDRDFAAADDVADRALEGETGPDCWRRWRARRGATSVDLAGTEIEALIERMSSLMRGDDGIEPGSQPRALQRRLHA